MFTYHIDICLTCHQYRFEYRSRVEEAVVRWQSVGELTTRRRISLQSRKIKRQHDYSRIQTVNFDDGRILFVQPDIQASANLALLRRADASYRNPTSWCSGVCIIPQQIARFRIWKGNFIHVHVHESFEFFNTDKENGYIEKKFLLNFY